MNKQEKILKDIRERLSDFRYEHSVCVAECAVKLAEKYGEDKYKAEIAALFHDMFRSTPVSSLDMYVKHFGLPENIIGNANLSHGKVAAEIMKRDYGIEDEDILNAEAAYKELEDNLRADLEHIETTYTGYDEYRYELQEIKTK